MKTASGLVSYAKAQLGKPYWWGTFGQVASASLLRAQRSMYPGYYNTGDFEGQFGRKVHDCAGLIKGYRWCDNPNAEPVYNGAQDVSAAGLYDQCFRRGPLSSMPDVPGVCVFRADLGHVGVYVGGGKVVEAMGHKWGVVETDLHRRNWTLWGMPDWIDYENESGEVYEPEENVPEIIRPSYYYAVSLPLLKPGMTDPAAYRVQQMLGIKTTSVMDAGTVEAVKAFQRENGLYTDGEIGGDTWLKLLRC